GRAGEDLPALPPRPLRGIQPGLRPGYLVRPAKRWSHRVDLDVTAAHRKMGLRLASGSGQPGGRTDRKIPPGAGLARLSIPPMPPESASMFEPQLYAVFGSPIGHSRSPDIHRRFAEQTGQDLIYTRQEVKAEEFESACREFFQLGGSGLNITLPLKELAFRLADRSTERARQAAAVNTLKLDDDGTLLGDNTDGVGLVRDLCETLGWQVADRRILLLGAGGAVRGVLGPLLAQKPEQLWIANRTAAR